MVLRNQYACNYPVIMRVRVKLNAGIATAIGGFTGLIVNIGMTTISEWYMNALMRQRNCGS